MTDFFLFVRELDSEAASFGNRYIDDTQKTSVSFHDRQRFREDSFKNKNEQHGHVANAASVGIDGQNESSVYSSDPVFWGKVAELSAVLSKIRSRAFPRLRT
jgi:hypothetical protein